VLLHVGFFPQFSSLNEFPQFEKIHFITTSIPTMVANMSLITATIIVILLCFDFIL